MMAAQGAGEQGWRRARDYTLAGLLAWQPAGVRPCKGNAYWARLALWPQIQGGQPLPSTGGSQAMITAWPTKPRGTL